jgi:L-aspartate oxidase
MTSRAGVLRSATGLDECRRVLADLGAPTTSSVDQDAWETTNLHTVSTLLAEAALLREETRGSHWREDHPERDDAHQSGHHDWWLEAGVPRHLFRPGAPSDVTVATRA